MLLRVRRSLFQLLDAFLFQTLSFPLVRCAERLAVVNAVDNNDSVPSLASLIERHNRPPSRLSCYCFSSSLAFLNKVNRVGLMRAFTRPYQPALLGFVVSLFIPLPP